MQLIKLRTRYSIQQEQRKVERRLRLYTWAASLLIGVAFVALSLLFTGCGTTGPQGPIGPAALQATIMLGTQFGLESHPEATPAVRVAATTVCSVAAGTNIAPAEIVAALSAAGVTNNYARLIVNSALAGYNIAFSYYGTNLTQFKPYADALCQGLTLGLPPVSAPGLLERASVRSATAALPPHLR